MSEEPPHRRALSTAVAKRPLLNARPNPAPTKKSAAAPKASLPETEKELTDRLLAGCPSPLGHTWGSKVFNSFSVEIGLPGCASQTETIIVQPLILPLMGDKLREEFEQAVKDDKNSLTLRLPRDFEAKHLISCFKYFYFRKLDYANQAELIQILKVAAHFQITPVVKAGDFLVRNLSLKDAIGIFMIARAGFKRGAQDGPLLPNTLKSIFDVFRRLDALPAEFVQLSADLICLILQAKDLIIGTENSVFCALRKWIHHDFQSRKATMIALCDCVQFHLIQKDYLLDVVETECQRDYPRQVKKKLQLKVRDAMRYHLVGDSLRRISKSSNLVSRRYDSSKLVILVPLKIQDVHERDFFSLPMFCFNGYYFIGSFRKSVPSGGGIQMLGFYLTLCIPESGLGSSFYVPIAFELETRNLDGVFLSNRGTYYSPFTEKAFGWGYQDCLGTSLDDALGEFSRNGEIEFRLRVAFFSSKPSSAPSRAVALQKATRVAK